MRDLLLDLYRTVLLQNFVHLLSSFSTSLTCHILQSTILYLLLLLLLLLGIEMLLS